jgi:DNA invertase Pin-like site-specific DNA recombinase
MKYAAAYIRVSDDRQDEYSPDSQIKLIREYAVRNGYCVPDEYVFYDDGISGRSVKKRKAFNDMIAFAKSKEHPFQAILVWKFSRFARNQEESIVYKSMLRRIGVSVISISETIDDSPFAPLIERIIEFMDEYYSTRLSQEVTPTTSKTKCSHPTRTHPPCGTSLMLFCPAKATARLPWS